MIRALLLDDMDWSDDHQGLMLLGAAVSILLGLIAAYPT